MKNWCNKVLGKMFESKSGAQTLPDGTALPESYIALNHIEGEPTAVCLTTHSGDESTDRTLNSTFFTMLPKDLYEREVAHSYGYIPGGEFKSGAPFKISGSNTKIGNGERELETRDHLLSLIVPQIEGILTGLGHAGLKIVDFDEQGQPKRILDSANVQTLDIINKNSESPLVVSVEKVGLGTILANVTKSNGVAVEEELDRMLRQLEAAGPRLKEIHSGYTGFTELSCRVPRSIGLAGQYAGQEDLRERVFEDFRLVAYVWAVSNGYEWSGDVPESSKIDPSVLFLPQADGSAGLTDGGCHI